MQKEYLRLAVYDSNILNMKCLHICSRNINSDIDTHSIYKSFGYTNSIRFISTVRSTYTVKVPNLSEKTFFSFYDFANK